MNIKLKSQNSAGITTVENKVVIREVMINEDFLKPHHESIAIGFSNRGSSGIVEFTVQEFDKLVESVNRKKHLIKSVKVLTGNSGAIKFKD